MGISEDDLLAKMEPYEQSKSSITKPKANRIISTSYLFHTPRSESEETEVSIKI